MVTRGASELGHRSKDINRSLNPRVLVLGSPYGCPQGRGTDLDQLLCVERFRGVYPMGKAREGAF